MPPAEVLTIQKKQQKKLLMRTQRNRQCEQHRDPTQGSAGPPTQTSTTRSASHPPTSSYLFQTPLEGVRLRPTTTTKYNHHFKYNYVDYMLTLKSFCTSRASEAKDDLSLSLIPSCSHLGSQFYVFQFLGSV